MKILNVLSTYFHQTIPLFMTVIYLILFYYFGLIKGFIGIWIFYKVYNGLIGKLFNLERVSPGDLIFMWNTDSEKYNLMIVLQLEKMNFEEIKNMLIEKGIKKFKKLRSRLSYKFFDWWWHEVDYEETKDRIEVYRKGEFSHDVSSNEGLAQYAYDELKVRFDYEKELAYNFKIIETGGEGEFKYLLIFKIDHILADGMSLMNFISALADNYHPLIFPVTMSKSISVFHRVMFYFLFPIYTLITAYINIFKLKPVKTIFKNGKKITGSPKFALSEKMNLEDYIKLNKKLGITFNDLMISIISSAIKKYSKTLIHGVPPYLLLCFPVNLKTLPKSIEEVEITNNTSGVCCKVQLIDNVKTEGEKISRALLSFLKNFCYIFTSKVIADSLFYYLPFYIAKKIMIISYKKMDLTVSNVPGPREPLYYSNCKVLDLIPFITPGFCPAFISIISYGKQFRMVINYDSVIEYNPHDLLDFILEEMKDLKLEIESETEVETKKNI